MAARYVEILQGEQPALLATLISRGLEQRYFEPATGVPYGVRFHRYASNVHLISTEDLERLRQALSERAESDPDLWSEHAARGTSKGYRLEATARSGAMLANGGPSCGELATGFRAFAEASKQVAPFLLATPVIRALLESRIARTIAAEAPDDAAREKATLGLHRTFTRAGEPDAVRETRDFYRLVLTVMDDDEAVQLLRCTSPSVAAGRMLSDFREIYGQMRDHARTYGWLRGPGWRPSPQTPKELVERMQAVVLRWTPETVQQAAQPEPAPDLEAVLGLRPSEYLARLTGSLRDLTALPSGRVGVLRRASAIAAPLFDKLAECLGCSAQEVLFAQEEEIEEALAGSARLPADVERRIRNSFTVERALGDLQVHGLETAPEGPEHAPDAAVLTGMTASRGRAIGRVRVILAAPQVHELGVGDVLVTATSTPDAIGGESVFPTRAGPAAGIGQVAAIVTDEGGFLSHAAIVAREHGIPCVVGTERATSALVDGQVVEVDATQAVGRIVTLDSS